MRTLALVVALLVAAVAASAQGPDPGHPDAASYAAWYAQDQGAQAANDVIGYASEKAADPEAEAAHAAWMACWAADDAGAGKEAADVCAPFYSPALEAAPEQPMEDPAPVAEAHQVALDTVTDVENAVADIQEDPTQAPSVALALVEKALGRILDLVGLSVDLGSGTASLVGDLMSLGIDGWRILGAAAAAGGLTVTTGIAGLLGLGAAGANGYADASGATLGAATGLLTGALAAGASGGAALVQASGQTGLAVAHMLATAMGASLDVYASIGSGIGDGAQLAAASGESGLGVAGAAIAGAASAVGHAVAEGATSMLDAAKAFMESLTGAFDAPQPVAVDTPVEVPDVDLGLDLPDLL